MKGAISIKPKVSIIIPVYNVEKYILKCLTSVIKQKNFQNFEVIIVNDGTQDRSIDCIQEMISCHKNIIVVNQKNSGLSEARNTGIRIAKGNFISFIDSDDWIEPDMISILYETAIQTNSDIAICNIRFVYENCPNMVKRKQHGFKNNDTITSRLAIDYFFEHKVITGHICNKIYKADLFKEHDVSFPKNKIFEDLPTCFKLLWHSKRIVFVEGHLYNYLQRKGSISRKFNLDIWHRIENVYLIKDFLVQRNYYEQYQKNFTSLLISSLFAVFIQLQKHKKCENYYLLKVKLIEEVQRLKKYNNKLLIKLSPRISIMYLIMILKGEIIIDLLLKIQSFRKRAIN